MRILLIGYGKMGKTIEQIALERGHSISGKIDIDNRDEFLNGNFYNADVAIEFTNPDSAYANITRCIDLGLAVVSGTTGWNNKIEEVMEYCTQKNGCFLHASNFSIGVNIFFEINKLLARLMAPHIDYSVSIKEVHHTQKKDAPSGTAVSLAEQIIQNNPSKKRWVNKESSDEKIIGIVSNRIDPAPGTHYVKYTSAIDNLEIIHEAHNRKGFALGAVLAAEFIAGKKGVFNMSDVLKF